MEFAPTPVYVGAFPDSAQKAQEAEASETATPVPIESQNPLLTEDELLSKEEKKSRKLLAVAFGIGIAAVAWFAWRRWTPSGRQYNTLMEGSMSGGKVCFSNFHITISSNVAPKDVWEQHNITAWLHEICAELFGDFSLLNGTVLKPAGSPSLPGTEFPAGYPFVSVKSRVSIELGGKRNYVHAHVLLEIAHRLIASKNEYGYKGVHVNTDRLRAALNARIHRMDFHGIGHSRQPAKIYMNCRLLTKGTDNSNKWLTLQYINKTVAKDNGGGTRDLRADREAGTAHDRAVQATMLENGVDYNVTAAPVVSRPANPRFK